MLATRNPYCDGTAEHHAWHQGYEGRTFMSADEQLNLIYDEGRKAAVDDVCKGTITEVKTEIREGHVFFVLYVNNHEVFKSMMKVITEQLKQSLDKALAG